MKSIHHLTAVTGVTVFCACQLAAAPASKAAPVTHPNVIFILTDDLGRGDIGLLGGTQGPTPNLDRLAESGIRFDHFYVASPICSCSRVGFTTGMFPARWGFTSYVHSRQGNIDSEQVNWLDPKAHTVAEAFKAAGYATAHFGKWHMGGGRDIDTAPPPEDYGFDESHVNCEGMGPRFVNFGNARTPTLNTEDGKYYYRYDFTRYWVDRSLDFIRRHKGQPFYLELWPQDVHTPFTPSQAMLERIQRPGLSMQQRRFQAVLKEYDRQIGRFLDAIHDLGLDDNTIIIFTGDNGPNPPFGHERTLGQRGQKWSLFEGGTHEPFFVRWTSHIPAGAVNTNTVVCAVDYFQTICALAGVKAPADVPYDGEDMSRAFLGGVATRTKPIYWEYGRNQKYFLYPKNPYDKSPNVAMREGDRKVLVNADGSDAMLFNEGTDPDETRDAAGAQPELASKLTKMALSWRKSLPRYVPPPNAGNTNSAVPVP